ncbi:hypothetical protein STIAU_0058 [Stigmatella aurantiaca DW4/3-1]|uniref:Uncharacterized protein n=1 Tax=Stigmatella aurantiaca (strain DW4/3-1) TaxID=378806 RepID=Q093N8_STIAD|nr:hypothetical protein STIAU_0058 [Stigmatella aurantiaca DW4/3-1]
MTASAGAGDLGCGREGAGACGAEGAAAATSGAASGGTSGGPDRANSTVATAARMSTATASVIRKGFIEIPGLQQSGRNAMPPTRESERGSSEEPAGARRAPGPLQTNELRDVRHVAVEDDAVDVAHIIVLEPRRADEEALGHQDVGDQVLAHRADVVHLAEVLDPLDAHDGIAATIRAHQLITDLQGLRLHHAAIAIDDRVLVRHVQRATARGGDGEQLVRGVARLHGVAVGLVLRQPDVVQGGLRRQGHQVLAARVQRVEDGHLAALEQDRLVTRVAARLAVAVHIEGRGRGAAVQDLAAGGARNELEVVRIGQVGRGPEGGVQRTSARAVGGTRPLLEAVRIRVLAGGAAQEGGVDVGVVDLEAIGRPRERVLAAGVGRRVGLDVLNEVSPAVRGRDPRVEPSARAANTLRERALAGPLDACKRLGRVQVVRAAALEKDWLRLCLRGNQRYAGDDSHGTQNLNLVHADSLDVGYSMLQTNHCASMPREAALESPY